MTDSSPAAGGAQRDRFQAFLEQSSYGYAEMDLEGAFTYISQRGASLIGYTQDEMLNMSVTDLLIQEDHERARENFAGLIANGPKEIPNEYTVVHKDGFLRHVEINGLVMYDGNEPIGFQATVLDITRRKEAEQKRIDSDEKLQSFIRDAAFGYAVTDMEGIIQFGNKRAAVITGYPLDELIGQPFHILLAPEDLESAMAAFGGVFEEPNDGTREFKIISKNGDSKYVEINALALFEQGQPIGTQVTIFDVTDRRQAELDTQRSQARYKALFESIPVEIIVVDKQGSITAFNQAIQNSSFRKPQIGDAMYTDYGRRHTCDMRQELLTAIQQNKVKHFPEQVYADNERVLQITIAPFDEGAIIVSQDITEQKSIEERMRQQSKLASIGELAAGVAHELNNPLQAIMSHNDLLGITLEEIGNQEVMQDIDGIKQAARRMKRIISDLLAFSRKDSTHMARCSINELIAKALALSGTAYATVEVQQEFGALPELMVDQDKLLEVFLNLISNSMDALQDKGHKEISITTEHDDAADLVRITYNDNGSGIPAEIMERIFDPFFTTKDPGSGTGLGLSIVFGIIEDHQGTIKVASSPGKGTEFIIELPAAPA